MFLIRFDIIQNELPVKDFNIRPSLFMMSQTYIWHWFIPVPCQPIYIKDHNFHRLGNRILPDPCRMPTKHWA